MIRRFHIFFLLFIGLASIGQSQTIDIEFGKNKVQYHDDFDNWWMYETDHFVTFWYGKGRNIAKTVIQIAEMDHNEIQGVLEHRMNDKIRIIVYLDHSDYLQSNIENLEENREKETGVARFYDNKVIVFFDGDHQNLRRQIRAGIAKAYLKSMFSGVSIQEIYHNLVSSELPEWFEIGLINYLEEDWNDELERDMSYYFTEKKRVVRKFSKFSKKYPSLAGHSMWYYLSTIYGKQKFSDFLYMVRIGNNLDKAFYFVFGKGKKLIYRDWKSFYEKRYTKTFENELKGNEQYVTLVKKKYPITRVRMNPDEETLVFAENNYGRVKVIKKAINGKKQTSLLKYGHKNKHQLTDFHYPLLRFDSSGKKLAIIYEIKDKLFLRLHDFEQNNYEEQLFPAQIQRIYSFDFYKPGIFVFSGSIDGFSDVFLFESEKRQLERVTNNYFDEKDIIVAEWENKKGLFILSNNSGEKIRAESFDSIPPIENFDLFFYDPLTEASERICHTPTINEKGIIIDKDFILSLTVQDEKTISEAWKVEDSIRRYRPWNASAYVNISDHDFKGNSYARVYKRKERSWAIDIMSMDLGEAFHNQPEIKVKKEPVDESKQESLEIEGDKYLELDSNLMFQSEFPDFEISDDYDFETEYLSGKSNVDRTQVDNKYHGLPIFNSSRAVASRLRFSVSDVTTKLDNNAIFEGLESYTRFNDSYSPPPSGFLVKAAVKDLFEDHIVEGGFKLASDFQGTEYFLIYDRLKNKIDWRYSLYRKSESRYDFIRENPLIIDKLKFKTNLAQLRAKYPFDIYRSLRLTGSLRFDESFVSSSDFSSLDLIKESAQRFSLDLAYVFDNTSEKSVNILSGSRYKIFAKFSNRFDIRLNKPEHFNVSTGLMGILGFDARHYFDLLEHSTIAIRLAGQSSFGTEKNIYFLGGVENWFFGQYNNTYPIPQDVHFAFKTQAANLRGFDYNVRNGSSFALMNIELRIPVFSYLFQDYIKMALVRDFQLTAFFDMGSAWYGLTPFSLENTANVYYHEAPPAIVMKIKHFKDPLVAGVGFGVRTSLFGYFLKLDYAWGIEGARFNDPKIYLSMGYDF